MRYRDQASLLENQVEKNGTNRWRHHDVAFSKIRLSYLYLKKGKHSYIQFFIASRWRHHDVSFSKIRLSYLFDLFDLFRLFITQLP